MKIPNSVIEKNQKAWDCFVLGQFYSDPPAQGTIHAIANGIWSKYHRDIVVTKMEGNAFLFRIPNASTRNRVISQGLWQFDGQTMFVTKWKPGNIPQKPELTSAPVWLELRNVPLQFFHEEGFEFIAGLVGEPKGLHPSTANMTNLEVAKVLTLIDPRKPLPEAVNVQFDSGEVSRVLVSSPWMPPVCSFCKEVGHSLKRCKLAPISCPKCHSTCHPPTACPRAKSEVKKKTQRNRRMDEPSIVVPTKTPTTPSSLCHVGNDLTVEKVATPPVQVASLAGVLPKDKVASTSEWVRVKSKAIKKKERASKVCVVTDENYTDQTSSQSFHDSLCIDIGLEKLQADQALLDAKSIETDSSDDQSIEDGVDPEIDDAQFMKLFSQRQQRLVRGKGPKSH